MSKNGPLRLAPLRRIFGRMMTHFIAAFVVLCAASTAQAFTTSGFAHPYGVVSDPATGKIYVSNINGDPANKDDNGFISRLNPDGTISEIRFIDAVRPDIELHAPKGMLIVGGKLFVTDIDVIRVFDLSNGKQLKNVDMSGVAAQQLYGIVQGPDEAVYVTDAGANAVYRVVPDVPASAMQWTKGDLLGQPRGIVWVPSAQRFYVSGWASGRIVAFDGLGKQEYLPKIQLRTLEGMAVDSNGVVYLASPALRAIYTLPPNMMLGSLALNVASPAGLSFVPAKNHILAVDAQAGSLTSYDIPIR